MSNFQKIISLLVFSLLFIIPHSAFAGTGNNMVGWAWSDNVGWISFNCTNNSSCGTVDYGVTENADGTLVGYAWSANVGWIQFGGLSGFPTASGTLAQNAQVVSGNLVGWAQALNAGGGWDGWISLTDTTAPAYGVTLSGSQFNGYAWGNGVVGWINFNDATTTGCGIAYCGGVAISTSVTLDAQSPLGTSISGNGNVTYGTAPYLVYTMSNLPNGTTCSLSKTTGATGFTTVSGITASGNTQTAGLSSGAYTFAINCLSGSTSVGSASVSFTVGAQPAGFSLGSNALLKIKFLPSGWTQSQSQVVAVNPVGGFTGNVTVTVTTPMTSPNASTTILYSMNGGTSYSASPTVTIPYNGSFQFRAEANMPITAAYCAGTGNPCAITLTGTSAPASPSTITFTLSPTTFNPLFQEQ